MSGSRAQLVDEEPGARFPLSAFSGIGPLPKGCLERFVKEFNKEKERKRKSDKTD